MSGINAFVTDGYDEKAFIKESPGIFNHAMEITYRPATYTDQTMIFDKQASLKQAKRYTQADEYIASEMAQRLQSWKFLDKDNDYREVDGAPEPDAENVMRLKPALFARLAVIIIHGTDGGDPDPRSADQKEPEGLKNGKAKLAEKQGNS